LPHLFATSKLLLKQASAFQCNGCRRPCRTQGSVYLSTQFLNYCDRLKQAQTPSPRHHMTLSHCSVSVEWSVESACFSFRTRNLNHPSLPHFYPSLYASFFVSVATLVLEPLPKLLTSATFYQARFIRQNHPLPYSLILAIVSAFL
jgi:hypothetical protein